jgi:hypothetical protein
LNKTFKLLIFPAISASQLLILFLFYLSFYFKGHFTPEIDPVGIVWGGLIASSLILTGQMFFAGFIWYQTKIEE